MVRVGRGRGRTRDDAEEDRTTQEAPPPPPAATEQAETKATTGTTDDDVEGILDEIDEVLESNAEEFVKGYVQKGGQ